MPGVIRVQKHIVTQLIEEARREPNLECCGLLTGRDGVITSILPAANALKSATSYEIAPEALFRLLREMRSAKLELLGIYHSHPRGENRPSPRDIERAYYADTAYFIVSPVPGAPNPVRAFSIQDGRVTELSITLL